MSKIVISGGKGGVGKSMLASCLAMLFAKEKKVAAVDCDVDAPNLAIWLGGIKRWDRILPVTVSKKPCIDFEKCNGCGLCAEKCRFGAISMSGQYYDENGSRCLGLEPVFNRFLCEGCGACQIVCPKGAIKLEPVQNGEIKIKKTKYGFVLISGCLFPGQTGSGKVIDEIKAETSKFKREIMLFDSAPGTGCPVIAVLKDADFVVLITEPTPAGFSDLKRVLMVVRHFKIAWALVINKWDINKDITKKIEKWASKKLLGKISYDKKIFRAIANLTPILETNLKAKKEIEEIYKNLISRKRKEKRHFSGGTL